MIHVFFGLLAVLSVAHTLPFRGPGQTSDVVLDESRPRDAADFEPRRVDLYVLGCLLVDCEDPIVWSLYSLEHWG